MSGGSVSVRYLAARLGVATCVALAFAGAACSSTSKTPATSADGAGADGAGIEVGVPFDGGLTADTPIVGSFTVELVAATATDPPRTSLIGVVSDLPTPQGNGWDLVAEVGGCRLSKPAPPFFCDPPCGAGEMCVQGGHCAGAPTSQNLGPVRVTGLGSKEFTVTPTVASLSSTSYQLPPDVIPPFPPAAEGADVAVIVSAGPYGPFTLHAKVVAPLSSEGVVTIQKDTPLDLTWDPPGQPDIARLRVRLDISHHGGLTGLIECDVADNGALEIAADLITKLIDLGVAGFNRITLSRVSTGIVAIAPGAVTLQVISKVARDVELAGYTSCNDGMDCPDGKVCMQNSLCQQ
jgi:hypothetical protein